MNVTLDRIGLALEEAARQLALLRAAQHCRHWADDMGLIAHVAPSSTILIAAGRNHSHDDGYGQRYQFTYHIPYMGKLHEIDIGLIID